MKNILSKILKEMKQIGLSSVQQYLSYKSSNTSFPISPAFYNSNSEFLVPNNAIFNNITLSNALVNVENMRLLGIDVSNDEMRCISKVFKYDVISFMLFLKSEDGDEGLVHVEEAFLALDTIVRVCNICICIYI
jgi:hypothetical protein